MIEKTTALIIGGTALLTALTALIYSFLKLIKQVGEAKETLPQKLKRQSLEHIEVQRNIEELKELTHADRVQIYEFHNGGRYMNGRSALKVSCTFEAVRVGVKTKQHELENIPISCIPTFIRTMLDEKEMVIDNIDMLQKDMPATYSLKKSMQVVSFFDIILNNKDGEPVGFLAVQYVGKQRFYAGRAKDKEIIVKYKHLIEHVLEKMI